MPSKNILRNEIKQLTDDFYSQEVILTKTNYKQSEANQLLIKCLVTYYGLPLIDEIYVKFINGNTSMSTAWVRDTMKEVWSANRIGRTKQDKKILTYVHINMNGSSIGRNQLIEILLEGIKAHRHG